MSRNLNIQNEIKNSFSPALTLLKYLTGSAFCHILHFLLTGVFCESPALWARSSNTNQEINLNYRDAPPNRRVASLFIIKNNCWLIIPSWYRIQKQRNIKRVVVELFEHAESGFKIPGRKLIAPKSDSVSLLTMLFASVINQAEKTDCNCYEF